MENHNVIGIGCYARPQRLSRIFKKLVQAYTLGPFKGNQLFNEPASKDIHGVDLLQKLMAGENSDISSGDCENPNLKAFSKITGFYLMLNDQGLNLSIFARFNNRRSEIVTTRLDGLTKLRQKRLN